MNLSLEAVVERLTKANTLVVTSHISPDPDAIGSSAGLAIALELLGKKTVCYYVDPIPGNCVPLVERLQREGRIAHSPKDVPAQLGAQPDLVVICDTATKDRVGKDGAELFALAPETLNIDHHVSNPAWGTLNYIDGKAAASALIVHRICKQLKIPSSTEVANLLWGGLADDTGSFRFSNTSADVLITAAELVAQGADPAYVAEVLYYRAPEHVLRLRGRAMSTLQRVADNRVALVAVSQALLHEVGAKAEDTDGIVDELRTLGGVEAVVFMREMAPHAWKLSLRAKRRDLDVGKVAAEFGGGGHSGAAGCKILGTQAEAIAQFEAAYRKVVR